MTELWPIIVFHGCHFVRHLGICNPICVKLLQVISGVIPSVSISNRFPEVYNRRMHTHTHTHTHTHFQDSITRNAMRRISPKNRILKISMKSYNNKRRKLLKIHFFISLRKKNFYELIFVLLSTIWRILLNLYEDH